MEQKELVKSGNLGFVENALKSVESMMQYAQMLLDSGLCPNHFYDKDEKGKIIVSKGKPAAVIMVLQHGLEVGLSPMQSLQQIVPVNGLVSIKGDGAKSLIFGSGVLEPGSWIEKESGSVEKEDYTFSITAKRRDNGLTMTRSFSVDMAKRAGLWIDHSKITGQDGWKWKLSPWYKYPDRMVRYRALGFLSRDLFTDVLAGMYTTEEAQDIPVEQTVIIESKTGATVTIPDKDFAKDRSKSITQKATDKIDKINKSVIPPVEPPSTGTINFENANMPVNKGFDEGSVEDANVVEDQEGYSLEFLTSANTESLMNIINTSPNMVKAITNRPGKNTNKKLRDIILDYQNGTLESNVQKVDSPIDNSQEKEPELNPESNKFGIEVTELPEEGQRAFEEAQNIYDEMGNVAGIDNKRFVMLVEERFPNLRQYPDREQFCFRATKREINSLLNSI